jgi:glycerol-1-phosphate dehydrogenase [NAD(P)+]
MPFCALSVAKGMVIGMKINVNDFSGLCGCGKEHKIFVKDIFVESGALQSLPTLFSEEVYGQLHKPVVICDENTYYAAGQAVLKLLPQASCVCLNPEGLHANERAVHAIQTKLPSDTDVLLAVGSGTIHDVTRYCAKANGIPFISVPTAASVDGFVSTVAAMTWDGFKKTMPGVSPICVVADSSVFSKAPYRLTASGVSDLLGKFTALADWKIAHIVTGEYFCRQVYDLETRALREVCSELEAIRAGEISACEKLMYALLLSGIAMQMVGNSRPASGAEHHFSHLWEMEAVNPHTEAYHGEKVSVGLMIAASVYHHAQVELGAGRFRIQTYCGIETQLLKKEISSSHLIDEILRENTDDPLAQIDTQELSRKIPEIINALSEIPSTEALKNMLTVAGCTITLGDIGLSEKIRDQSIQISPYMRNRLTFMRLLKLFAFDV